MGSLLFLDSWAMPQWPHTHVHTLYTHQARRLLLVTFSRVQKLWPNNHFFLLLFGSVCVCLCLCVRAHVCCPPCFHQDSCHLGSLLKFPFTLSAHSGACACVSACERARAPYHILLCVWVRVHSAGLWFWSSHQSRAWTHTRLKSVLERKAYRKKDKTQKVYIYMCVYEMRKKL